VIVHDDGHRDEAELLVGEVGVIRDNAGDGIVIPTTADPLVDHPAGGGRQRGGEASARTRAAELTVRLGTLATARHDLGEDGIKIKACCHVLSVSSPR
jgi:hypothetical protein